MEPRRRRVLVAEDELTIRQLIAEALTDQGYEVFDAENGSDAFWLTSEPDRIDVVVADINIPDFDGIAVARQARSKNPAVKVLFVSGSPERLRTIAFDGDFQVLAKPFGMREMVAAVTALCAGDEPGGA